MCLQYNDVKVKPLGNPGLRLLKYPGIIFSICDMKFSSCLSCYIPHRKNPLDIFNNREIAVGIWLFVAALLALLSKSVRKIFLESFPGLCKLFFSRWILVPLALAAVYIILAVFVLHKIGYWNSGLLKNTIFWCISVPFVSMFRISPRDGNFFRKAAKDNFRATVALEFVVAFYTLSLWAELLIIPVATVLVTMHAVAEAKEDCKLLEKLLSKFVLLIGVSLLIYAAYRLVADFASFARPGTLTEFSLPILLSILFLPFLFTFAIFADYDKEFRLMELRIKDDDLRRYAKRAALLGFHLRTGLLRRWIRNINFKTPTNRSEIKASVTQVKELAAREKNPAFVPPEQGWSPYHAGKFLASEGLATSDYRQVPSDDGLWFADSEDLAVNNDILSDCISYCVEGNEFIARKLELKADFLSADAANATDRTGQRFLEIATQLFQEALNQEMPDELRKNIMTETPHSQIVEGKSVKFTHKQWSPGPGYSLRLIIEKTVP